MPTDIINPFTDIPTADLTPQENTRYGSQYFRDVAELQVGFGSNVMRVDQQGLWLGAKTFAAAPFKVDMQGNITASSLSLSTLSGNLDDIDDGVTYKKPTFNEVTGAGRAYNGLNSSGEIIKGFLNSQLSAQSLPTNGVRVDSSGIYGRKAGSTNFYIDSSGNAYFVGDLASSTMTASTITGSTITGTTLTTANSGQRVVLTSTLAQFYNSSGTEIVETYASGSSYLLKGMQSTSSIYLDAGSSGTVAFLSNGSLRVVWDNSSGSLYPATSSAYDLGNISFKWRDIWNTGIHVYQGIDQPVIYFGYASGTSITNDNFVPFSLSHPSTGNYTITHNLGHTNYNVQLTVLRASGSGAYIAKVASFNSSSFSVIVFDDTGTSRDSDFFFTVYELP